MAQWREQFMGKTHATKVKFREQQLRKAVDVWRSMAAGEDRDKKEKKIGKLAERLLLARVRQLKASLNSRGPMAQDSSVRKKLEAEIQDVIDGGVAAILAEFDAEAQP